jgi:hypothetical protein
MPLPCKRHKEFLQRIIRATVQRYNQKLVPGLAKGTQAEVFFSANRHLAGQRANSEYGHKQLVSGS